MNIVEKIKALLKEAELYHKQGLLNEAMGKYDNVTKLIQGSEQLKSSQTLVDGVSKKIRALQKDIDKVEQASDSPEVPAEIQDLIKKMFAFSSDKDEDEIALDGAIALAKFGQFERALKEFNELIKKDSLRIVAAKNIIRCLMALSSVDEVFDQYEQWLSSDIFVPGQLEKLRVFINAILAKDGIDRTLPKEKEPSIAKESIIDGSMIQGLEIQEEEEEEEEEILDINSIGITMPDGPQKGQIVEINVSFQSANVISLLISGKDKDLLENFQVGAKLDDVQFYSPIAMFNGTAIVSGKTEIESGPRRGDYNLDIKVVST